MQNENCQIFVVPSELTPIAPNPLYHIMNQGFGLEKLRLCTSGKGRPGGWVRNNMEPWLHLLTPGNYPTKGPNHIAENQIHSTLCSPIEAWIQQRKHAWHKDEEADKNFEQDPVVNVNVWDYASLVIITPVDEAGNLAYNAAASPRVVGEARIISATLRWRTILNGREQEFIGQAKILMQIRVEADRFQNRGKANWEISSPYRFLYRKAKALKQTRGSQERSCHEIRQYFQGRMSQRTRDKNLEVVWGQGQTR